MNWIFPVFIAGAFTLSPILAYADDETPSGYTTQEQQKLKKESDAKKAAAAKMTPEEKAAAKKAKDAQAQKYQNATIKATQNPGDSRNMGINKSAEASKAGPTPQRDYINTPEAEQKMMKQHGQ